MRGTGTGVRGMCVRLCAARAYACAARRVTYCTSASLIAAVASAASPHDTRADDTRTLVHSYTRTLVHSYTRTVRRCRRDAAATACDRLSTPHADGVAPVVRSSPRLCYMARAGVSAVVRQGPARALPLSSLSLSLSRLCLSPSLVSVSFPLSSPSLSLSRLSAAVRQGPAWHSLYDRRGGDVYFRIEQACVRVCARACARVRVCARACKESVFEGCGWRYPNAGTERYANGGADGGTLIRV
jgi:hypothetical protein